MCSVITAKTLATHALPRTVQTRSPHQQHHITMTGCTADHVTTTTMGTNCSPISTDAAKEDTLTSQDHTTDPTVAEAPVTIRRMHPAPHPTTTTAFDTHQLTNALDDTLTRTQYTGTTVTYLRHTTFPARITLKTIPQTKADLV